MDIYKMTAQRTDSFVGNRRALIGLTALAVGIMIVLGWSFAPSSVNSVSASNQEGQDGASAEMLNYALNFKSASNLGVFGGNSVSDEGSEIRGVVGSAGEITGVASNALSVGDASETRRDLLDTFSYVDQLPCTQVDDSNLGGRSFGPGVYCLGSATLAGRMTVDAGGDANARFVFRVNGTFTAEDASSIDRIGGAQATNVYIFSRDAARIGGEATIGSNVISREDVTVGHGSTITGKVIGVNGDVTTSANIVAAGTGYIEICKELQLYDRIPVGTLFTFTVTGAVIPAQGTVQVPAGAFGSPNCSPPIQVASGNQTITEAVRANTALVGITVVPANRAVSGNLALQQLVVAVPDGDVSNQTVATFRNQTTRTGTIEICKFAAVETPPRTPIVGLPADPDVTGFFNFTVQGAFGQTFAVPVGFCSGPITVTIAQQNGGPSPSPTQAFTANVTELAKPTYVCEDATTFPANALLGFFPDLGFDANGIPIANVNGCYANVALNVAGGAANQTTVRFFNRSLPGRIKICKITADPATIPIGVMFRFSVLGVAGPLPGSAAQVDVDVLAGPAAQGGFCAFVPGTWVVGANILIIETGISPNNTVSLPTGITASMVRLSRIRASTPFIPGFPASGTNWLIASTIPNPYIFGTPSPVGYAAIQARNTTAEVEFTNFIYRPAILKLCKVAGPGVAVGTPFQFTIAPVDPLTTWPYPADTITVLAGSCTFVNGPFPPDANFPGVGLFNYGTLINVTEILRAGTTVTAITSPTLGGTSPAGTLTVDLPKRLGTLSLNQPLLPGNLFNEISFVNVAAATPPPGQGMRYDFDGDHKSDLTIYRPTVGTWWFAPSSTGGVGFRSIHFGQAGDIPVAADYDGDGVSDAAVYRNGIWHVLGSQSGYMTVSFGLTTDIPQVGDYDGDNKADFAVYRQSNGTWYIMGSSTGFNAVQFGNSTDIPVAADFDGDGRMDPAVYRNGTWYLLQSASGFSAIQFGIAGDVPLHVDFDGDGMADVAVYRGGIWYILGSSEGFRTLQFGVSTDIPVPADYDGDGKMDIAVYRPSATVWHILNSSQSLAPGGGYVATQFGSPGDQLLPY